MSADPKRSAIAMELSVQILVGGEDEPIEIPAEVDVDGGTIWVYVETEKIRAEIESLLNAPTGVTDFGLGLHGLAVSQHYRMAWVSARDRSRRQRSALHRVLMQLAEWDRVSKGESPTTKALRAAIDGRPVDA